MHRFKNPLLTWLLLALALSVTDANGHTVGNAYDNNYRLVTETITEGANTTITAYEYDNGNNRTRMAKDTDGNGTEDEVHGYTIDGQGLNQLQSFTKTVGANVDTTSYTYDLNGNRATRTNADGQDDYTYDEENRLVQLDDNTGIGLKTYHYVYDYRMRRVVRDEEGDIDQIVFSGGTSLQEYETVGGVPDPAGPNVEYVRGSDYGGGVGGVLYTLRAPAGGGAATAAYNHYNSRGDVVAKTDSLGAETYQASYEAFGTRTRESGATQDRQKANTKDEDPHGHLNEGFRLRDLEADVFITRDPLGFVDGPNMYAYVVQNPWTKFDPEGLAEFKPSWGRARDTLSSGAKWLARPVKAAAAIAVEGWVSGGQGVRDGVDHFANPDSYSYPGGKATTYAMGAAGIGLGAAVLAGEIIDVATIPGKGAFVKKAGRELAEAGVNKLAKGAAESVTEKSAEKIAKETGEKLYRGTPSNRKADFKLAEEGVVKPRGTATDATTLQQHVENQPTSSGVTSWTDDPEIAKGFAGSDGIINSVNKSDVKNKIINPVPANVKAMQKPRESETLIEGVVTNAKVEKDI